MARSLTRFPRIYSATDFRENSSCKTTHDNSFIRISRVVENLSRIVVFYRSRTSTFGPKFRRKFDVSYRLLPPGACFKRPLISARFSRCFPFFPSPLLFSRVDCFARRPKVILDVVKTSKDMFYVQVFASACRIYCRSRIWPSFLIFPPHSVNISLGEVRANGRKPISLIQIDFHDRSFSPKTR